MMIKEKAEVITGAVKAQGSSRINKSLTECTRFFTFLILFSLTTKAQKATDAIANSIFSKSEKARGNYFTRNVWKRAFPTVFGALANALYKATGKRFMNSHLFHISKVVVPLDEKKGSLFDFRSFLFGNIKCK